MLEEKAFLATINQVVTLSLRTYGMTVNQFHSFGSFLRWQRLGFGAGLFLSPAGKSPSHYDLESRGLQYP